MRLVRLPLPKSTAALLQCYIPGQEEYLLRCEGNQRAVHYTQTGRRWFNTDMTSFYKSEFVFVLVDNERKKVCVIVRSILSL